MSIDWWNYWWSYIADLGSGAMGWILVIFVVTVGQIAVAILFRNRRESAEAKERQRLTDDLIQERLRRELAEQATKVAGGEGSASFERIRRAQEELDNRAFEDNAGRHIVLRSLEFEGLRLLGDSRWTLQLGVNLLLGRNGYGKSLLLRSLAGLLARHDVGLLPARSGTTGAHAALEIMRDDEVRPIRRLVEGFTTDSICPIPVLAIPDTRFLNRAEDSLRLPPDPFKDLRRHGARHFLEQLPYHGVVNGLLYGMCLDYVDRGRTFDLPLFRLLTDVFAGLTDESFRFVSIDRVDNLSFHMLVQTEGNDEPIPIQLASQGTLSVLAMFGLIYQHLKELAGDEAKASQQPGIVIIDEIDAHLHPKWQQRIVALLRRVFPNVQFVLSAHSPLLVAGCRYGEAAVMRKSEQGFVVEPLLRDFVGTPADEIYRAVFDVEDGLDHTYLTLAEGAERARQLEARGAKLDSAQRRDLARLREEGADSETALLRKRVARSEKEQSRALERDITEEALQVELHRLRAELAQTRAEIGKTGTGDSPTTGVSE